MYLSVADQPDSEMGGGRGGGGVAITKENFGARVWSKHKGQGPSPGTALPLLVYITSHTPLVQSLLAFTNILGLEWR